MRLVVERIISCLVVASNLPTPCVQLHAHSAGSISRVMPGGCIEPPFSEHYLCVVMLRETSCLLVPCNLSAAYACMRSPCCPYSFSDAYPCWSWYLRPPSPSVVCTALVWSRCKQNHALVASGLPTLPVVSIARAWSWRERHSSLQLHGTFLLFLLRLKGHDTNFVMRVFAASLFFHCDHHTCIVLVRLRTCWLLASNLHIRSRTTLVGRSTSSAIDLS